METFEAIAIGYDAACMALWSCLIGGEGAGLAVNITGAPKAHKKEKLKRIEEASVKATFKQLNQTESSPLKQLNRDRRRSLKALRSTCKLLLYIRIGGNKAL